MAFNIYLAGSHLKSTDMAIMEKGANRLFSQLLDRKGASIWIDYHKTVAPRKLFIDSGAYTAHTKGVQLDVDEYISYVNSNAGVFSAIAQVDKIPGTFGQPKTRQEILEAPELSWDNYLYMRERVIDYEKLLPIFHQGEDFKHLKRMLEATFIDYKTGKDVHIPYIGISPANDTHTRDKMKWLDKVFLMIQESSNPNVKTHAFGMTSLPLLEAFPFYSADSTSWIMAGVNGSIMTRRGLVLVSNRKKDDFAHLTHSPKPVQELIISEIEERGYTLEDAENSYQARVLINAMYLMEWAENYKYKPRKKQKQLF